jgi:hypothetical protein
MYLFDTNVITNIFRKKPAPRLLERLAQTPHQEHHISVRQGTKNTFFESPPSFHVKLII